MAFAAVPVETGKTQTSVPKRSESAAFASLLSGSWP